MMLIKQHNTSAKPILAPLLFIILSLPGVIAAQERISYFKTYTTSIGQSSISHTSLTAKTFSFSYPVYKMLVDTVQHQLVISVRQKDASGKNYTNLGYHLTLKSDDSIVGVYQDSKLDLELLGDYLLMSNKTRTSRFNRVLAYEQFEYPSRIIMPVTVNNSGLTYNPAVKNGSITALSAINLIDGKMLWNAAVPSKYNWNSYVFNNDSVMLLAAGGLNAIDVRKGLLWRHELVTGFRSKAPLTFSSFNQLSLKKILNPIITTQEEGYITQACSNILRQDGKIYFAGIDKLICVSEDGQLQWERDLTDRPMSHNLLYDNGSSIVMINLGIAFYENNVVLLGKPFVAAFSKQNGEIIFDKNIDPFMNISDVIQLKDLKILANRNRIIKVSPELMVETMIDIDEVKYGKFLEFIDGSEYFVEKEGFFVPLNFINDNVIYFKSDHGKVFGLNTNSVIEYEYHYTELYKYNCSLGKKKVISQKGRSLLISDNFELLHTFNSGDPMLVQGNKLYLASGRLLHVINEEDIK